VIRHVPANGTIERTMRSAASQPGLMAARVTRTPEPGLMAIRSRPVRGLMVPDPTLASFDWSADGTAFLWLVALILAVALWIGLLGQGTGRL
jgi:hypothetical protein